MIDLRSFSGFAGTDFLYDGAGFPVNEVWNPLFLVETFLFEIVPEPFHRVVVSYSRGTDAAVVEFQTSLLGCSLLSGTHFEFPAEFLDFPSMPGAKSRFRHGINTVQGLCINREGEAPSEPQCRVLAARTEPRPPN